MKGKIAVSIVILLIVVVMIITWIWLQKVIDEHDIDRAYSDYTVLKV